MVVWTTRSDVGVELAEGGAVGPPSAATWPYEVGWGDHPAQRLDDLGWISARIQLRNTDPDHYARTPAALPGWRGVEVGLRAP